MCSPVVNVYNPGSMHIQQSHVKHVRKGGLIVSRATGAGQGLRHRMSGGVNPARHRDRPARDPSHVSGRGGIARTDPTDFEAKTPGDGTDRLR